MRLNELKEGENADIMAFINLDNEVRKRLMVMGLLPNTPVTLVRRAPMGDPLQIQVRGVSLAVREKIAASIEVEVVR